MFLKNKDILFLHFLETTPKPENNLINKKNKNVKLVQIKLHCIEFFESIL